MAKLAPALRRMLGEVRTLAFASSLQRLLPLALLSVMALYSVPAAAQAAAEAAVLERRVKGAFLYKFAGFVDWPESAFARPDTPLAIAIAGDDAMADDLVAMTAGRAVSGRPVVVRRAREGELAGTHILFVARSESARLSHWVRATQTRPVMIVTESEGALTQGSTINFVVTSGRVRFEVALDTAEKRGLRISSRLLSVAHGVRMGQP